MKIIKAARIVILITGLVVAGVFFSSPVSAQDISGTWHGKLSIPTGSLTIVFHISQTEQGTYVTTLDSPDQGANGIKTQTTSFNDSILTIQIPIIHASYKGKLDSNQTISGTFTQGMPIPLNLEKGEAGRPKRPQEPQPPFPYKSEEVIVKNEQDDINLAVLRCDDRGTAASQGNHATATNEDFARDTEAAINYLRSRKEINAKKIGIIGHSAGGIIAFIVAKKDPSIAFVVSLAGAGVKGDSLMLKQVELISKSQGMPDAVWQGMKPSIRNRYAILQQTDKTPEELQKELYADITQTMSPEQLKDLNTIQQISAQINSMTSPWYLHFMRYDPAEDLKELKCPVLALNGEKDIQMDAAMNLTAIQERITGNGNKNVTIKAYPNLNHLFQTCEKGTLAEYGQLEETISPEVLKDITEWILKQTK